jgi:transposase
MPPYRLLALLSSVIVLVGWARERANPIAELAKDLRIRESCLRNWVAQANADERGSQTRLTRDEKEARAAAAKE